ncbi:hypothetical protein Tco_0807368 [Tanacetum coccineum]
MTSAFMQQVATTTAAAVATTAGSSSTTTAAVATAAAAATAATAAATTEEMKAMKDHIRVGIIPFKTDQEILDEIVPSDNRQNMSGRGRKLPGGGSTSRRQEQQEKELYRKQAEEAQARAL